MIGMILNNGDLVVSEFGDISLHLTDDDNIIQTANSAINTIKGENIFHPDYGNDAWNQRLKASDSGFDIIKMCAKDAILQSSDEIVEVVSIDAVAGDEYSECIIQYVIRTVDGKQLSSSTSINIL